MITFFTSLYRSDRYLAKYIKNLKQFAQTLLDNNIDFEFLIIANDATQKEKELKDIFKDCEWFNYIEVPREPLYVTWNRAISLGRGDIIGFWHGDDVRYPQAIIKGLKKIKDGADLVYFPFMVKWYLNILNFSILVKCKRFKTFRESDFGNSMPFASFFLFTRELYKKVGPFDEQFKIVADFDWCVRAYKVSNKFSFCNEMAGFFRVDGKGLSSGGKPKHTAENNVVYRRHNIPEKIEDIGKEFMNDYKIDHIFYKGKWYKFDEASELVS